MKDRGIALLGLSIGVTAILMPTPVASAQEAEVATTIGKGIVKALGKDATEFGGEAVARQTAKRLLTEAVESAGSGGGQIAEAQLKRILTSGNESLIFDLKSISGKSLPLLEDVTDKALPSAVGTLARPGVGEGIQTLSSTLLQRAALDGEMRLPGAGLKLVEQYGSEGAQLARTLSEDQANSVLSALRPKAINSLPGAERSSLLKALTSRPDARVFNFEGATGPLLVVAGGIVIWHGIDVTLSPEERVTERPDGTVVREKSSVGVRAVQNLPLAFRELSPAFKWTGITFAVGASVVAGILLLRHQKWKRSNQIR